METTTKIKATALVGYEIRGVKSYKLITFEIDHWSLCLQAMQKTKDWEQARDLVYHNLPDSKIVGITFNFSNES